MVGSGVALFIGTKLALHEKFKLDNRCSNNQAEQLAIRKALDEIDLLNRHSISPLTATMYTDSRVSLDSLHNPNNHAFLVEGIRKKGS